MHTSTLKNQRVAILEDDPTNRDRLSSLISMSEGIPLPVAPPAPTIGDLEAFFAREQVTMLVSDHRLSERGKYAAYCGAAAVAVAYRSGRGGVLVTAYESADAELSIRQYRRWIPVLIHAATDLKASVLESALKEADSEVRQHLPTAQRVPYRTIMTVKSLIQKGGETVVKVVGQWDPTVEVGFPLHMLPEGMRSVASPGNMLLAQVNIEAEQPEDLFFDKFEVPDPDVLRKSQAFFDRP